MANEDGEKLQLLKDLLDFEYRARKVIHDEGLLLTITRGIGSIQAAIKRDLAKK